MNNRPETAQKIGIFFLGIFLFFRPLSVSFHHIGSVSILDLFGIAASFLILMGLLINLKWLRLDALSLVIVFFMLYCMTSLLWGSEIKDTVKTLLAFLPFFLTKTVADRNNSPDLLWILALGYLIPTAGSLVMMATGMSQTMVTGSMVVRDAGLSSGVHTLGHLMLFFSFVFALFALCAPDRKIHIRFLFLVLLASLICLFRTYTRTVILGGFCFWFCLLFFWKRKWFYALLILGVCFSAWQFNTIAKIATQQDAASNWQQKKVDMNTAGSGRLQIWTHNLACFSSLPFTRQILGVGLGKELDVIPGTMSRKWIGSHNDYMSLTITTGLMGLFIYLCIYLTLILTLITARESREYRICCLAMVGAVLVMNFVSNSYIVRFQMAQLFWFIAGLIYGRLQNGPSKEFHV